MKEKKENESILDKLIERLQANYENKNPVKVHRMSGNLNEEADPQEIEMLITDHPHREEMLD